MKATETRVQDFLSSNKTRFVIPVYQRNYDWTQEQCKQLLNDILFAGKDDKISAHFIGSIVYVHDDVYTTSGIKELVIIDGQQRLTTLTLIYLALYKLAQKLNDGKMAEEIYETYLINKFTSENEKLKLKPTENNDKAFSFLLSDHEGEQFPEFSRLIENYSFFRKCIGENNYKQVEQGLRKLIFVEISLDRQNDNPQRIFESLNSTGLELSQADLIRNYILMGLSSKEQNSIYKNYWSTIERYAKNETNNNSLVSDFIRDYLTLVNKKIPNKNKVYQEFKNRYPFTEISELEDSLKDIKRLVIHYNKLVNPINEPDTDIRQQLEYIDKLEINVAFPFLLQVYDDYACQHINKNEFIAILEFVQCFTWRRFIVGLPTNALNKIFMSLYEKVSLDNYVESVQVALMQRTGTGRMPRDQEVLDALRTKDMYNIKNKNRLYFLERLEHHNNTEIIQVSGNSDITTEHIFPQNPDLKWKQELSNEDYHAMLATYLHTAANLTLSGNNGKLGNKSFTEKRDIQNVGYKDSGFWLNKQLAKLEKWDVAALKQRYDSIAARFLEIWSLPTLTVNMETPDNGEVNIFEADEPKYKTLEYAIFLDQKLNITQVSQLYTTVLSTLFELQPETFYSSNLADRLGLVKGEDAASKLRTANAIGPDYFVEGNLNSNDKFNRLKQALEVFELEEELIIKYAQ
jgi:uncharacterized protein with ParB-like and HNH nuclease domain